MIFIGPLYKHSVSNTGLVTQGYCLVSNGIACTRTFSFPSSSSLYTNKLKSQKDKQFGDEQAKFVPMVNMKTDFWEEGGDSIIYLA